MFVDFKKQFLTLSYVVLFATQASALEITSGMPGLTDLGRMSEQLAFPTGISFDANVIVGIAFFGKNQYRAWRKVDNEEMLDLGETEDSVFISADGSTVVGALKGKNGFWRWTQASGRQVLKNDGGDFEPCGVTGDGKVIVGRLKIGNQIHIARWSVTDGLQDLGDASGFQFDRHGITADGKVIAGSLNVGGQSHIARWSESTGLKDLGTGAPNAKSATIAGIAADGKTMVAILNLDGANQVAILRQNGRAKKLLGPGLKVNDFAVLVTAISPDGHAIIGVNHNNTDHKNEYWLWTEKKGIVPLGGFYLRVDAVSTEGQVLVGHVAADRQSPPLAFRLSTSEALPHGDKVRDSRKQAGAQQRVQDRVNRELALLQKSKPAKIMATAMDWESEGKLEQARKAYQILISQYPNTLYATKALDKLGSTKVNPGDTEKMLSVGEQDKIKNLTFGKQHYNGLVTCTGKKKYTVTLHISYDYPYNIKNLAEIKRAGGSGYYDVSGTLDEILHIYANAENIEAVVNNLEWSGKQETNARATTRGGLMPSQSMKNNNLAIQYLLKCASGTSGKYRQYAVDINNRLQSLIEVAKKREKNDVAVEQKQKYNNKPEFTYQKKYSTPPTVICPMQKGTAIGC